jgi:hypothetical protein
MSEGRPLARRGGIVNGGSEKVLKAATRTGRGAWYALPAMMTAVLCLVPRGHAPTRIGPDPQAVVPRVRSTFPRTTLEEAVRSRTLPPHAARDLDCLARTVYFEARGDVLEGQLAVARTVINRTRSEIFPGTICEVVTQPHQFSFVRHRIIPEVDRQSAAWRTAMGVAAVAIEGWPSRAARALFFHASYVSPGWKRPALGRIGAHFFYL